MVKIAFYQSDLLGDECDVLILEHASGFHGFDQKVASRVGFSKHLSVGEIEIFRSTLPGPDLLMFTRNLAEMDYGDLRRFASLSLMELQQRSIKAEDVSTTIHGPGFGLDEKESLLSLVAGFRDAVEQNAIPSELRLINIVDVDRRRIKRWQSFIESIMPINIESETSFYIDVSSRTVPFSESERERETRGRLSSFGIQSSAKPKIFVAMPFDPIFTDEWEIGIREAANANGALCERIDESTFTGDILVHIKHKITTSNLVLAVLNGGNPNVFLEIGFAWGVGKPTVLILKAGEKFPFDIQGQRCILYTSILDLRTKLHRELDRLRAQGLLAGQNGTFKTQGLNLG